MKLLLCIASILFAVVLSAVFYIILSLKVVVAQRHFGTVDLFRINNIVIAMQIVLHA